MEPVKPRIIMDLCLFDLCERGFRPKAMRDGAGMPEAEAAATG